MKQTHSVKEKAVRSVGTTPVLGALRKRSNPWEEEDKGRAPMGKGLAPSEPPTSLVSHCHFPRLLLVAGSTDVIYHRDLSAPYNASTVRGKPEGRSLRRTTASKA